MNQENNKIQQGTNYTSIVGEVLEINLKKIKDGEFHLLEMLVEAGENNKITCKKFVTTRKDGELTGGMKSINTILKEYVAKNDDKNTTGKGTMIKAISNSEQKYKKGSLCLNEYFGNEGEGNLISQLQVENFSPTRVYGDDIEPMSDFSIEGIITSINPVMSGAEPTGVLEVEIATFNYKGELVPFTIIYENTDKIKLADDFPNYYRVGDTAEFFGEICNKVVTREIVEEQGFGEQKKEMVEEKRVGLFGRGALQVKRDGTEYTEEQVELGNNERKAMLEAKRQNQIEGAKKKKSQGGFGGGFGGGKPNPANFGGIDGFHPTDNDDIPF